MYDRLAWTDGTAGRAVARDIVGPVATRCSRVKATGAKATGAKAAGAKAALPMAPSALLAGLADCGLAGLKEVPRVAVATGLLTN